MKCKQTREVIDTASRHTLYSDSVKTHLSGCPDCRRRADGTASLFTLLGAQPRVEAPADFDIRVSMGIARAQADLLSDKTASLLTLLKAQPRVEAPADFDFRLSASIARAQAERLNRSGVLERAWEKLVRSLTFGQATAMAAAALVVATASTIYLNFDKSSPEPGVNVAYTKPADSTPTEVKPAQVSPAIVAKPAVNSGRVSAGQSIRVRPVEFRPDDLQARNNSADDTPRRDKFYNPTTKRVMSPGVAFGAEEASVTMAKWGAL